jgi:phosphatidate cytidylyltransferase
VSALRSRILVAAVGLPLVVAAVWGGGWWLLALVACVGATALHEYFSMTRPLRPLAIAGYAGLLGILAAAQLSGLAWAVAALLGSLALSFLLKGLTGTAGSATVTVGVTLLGPAWIGLGLACALLLRSLADHGLLATLAVLLAVFADDTAAYAVGRALGRHKLAPAISPGKTWEGFLAGTGAALVTVFLALYQDRESFLSIGESLILGLVIAVASPLGDLFESMLKRDLGVKDAGRLLAGHGGVLDRIDSLLFALPAGYFTVLALGG